MVKTWKITFTQAGEVSELLRLPLSTQSLDETSLNLPGGAYTTLRTYSGRKALHLEDHLLRLEQTAAMTGKPIRLEHAALCHAMRRVLHEVSAEQPEIADWRFRLTLDLEVQRGMVYLSIQPLDTPPEQAYREGVRAVTCSLQRQLPKAKLTRFIARAGAVRQTLPPGVNEAIMYDEQGNLLEGLSSNFFALRAGALYTAEAGVLLGITRSLALQAAGRLNLTIQFQPVTLVDLPHLEEAFITSASRGVLPVRQIDQTQIGQTCPGPLTRSLMQAYQALIEEQLELI